MPRFKGIVCAFSVCLAVLALILATAGCGHDKGELTGAQEMGWLEPVPGTHSAHPGWPTSLPDDMLQPWESTDAAGTVIPPGDAAGLKGSSVINQDSEAFPGVERWLDAVGGVSENGEALRLTSEVSDISWAIYRLPMGGVQPGVVGTDTNVVPLLGGGMGVYYVGLADYGREAWEWHGPFMDNHLRFATAEAVAAGHNYISPLGNTFVCVLTYDTCVCDVVCVGANPVNVSDVQPPPQPTGLAAAPVAGGLELDWNDVLDGTLAGYRIYYSRTSFSAGEVSAVQRVDYLVGDSRYLLSGLAGETFVRISAVDISGNESPPSDLLTETPSPGGVAYLVRDVEAPSGMIHDEIEMSAVGGTKYDWDMDGDGIYEITGTTESRELVDTGSTGIIRPAVRSTGAEDSMVACGAVSLLIQSNMRPVASGYADPSTGEAPLTVDFSGVGEDEDGTIAEYAWDFNGDGTYDWTDPATGDTSHEYAAAGVYNAKFRVTDDLGAWDCDTVTVIVSAVGSNQPPTAALESSARWGVPSCDVTFDASGSSDPDGWIVNHQWDFDGDGFTDLSTGTDAKVVHRYDVAGEYTCRVRVVDNNGAEDTSQVDFTAGVWETSTLFSASSWAYYTALDIAAGFPAVVFSAANPSLTYFVRASDAAGQSWGSAKQAATPIAGIDMEIVNLNPAIAQGYGPYYVRSLDTIGNSWPSVVDLDAGQIAGNYVSMSVVAGNPAICYLGGPAPGNQDLCYVRATDVDGGAWASHVLADGDAAGPRELGTYTSMLVADGRPAIAYSESGTQNGLRFVRANDATGGSWGTPVAVDMGQPALWVSMKLVEGRPAIVYQDSTNETLKFVTALDAQGSTWGTPLIIDNTAAVGACFAVVDGRPAIAYSYTISAGVVDICFIWAQDPQGSSWGSRKHVVSGGNNLYASLAEVDGRPGISFDDTTGHTMKYAVLVEP